MSAEELERRALRAARDRYDRVRAAHAAACQAIAGFEPAPAQLPLAVSGASDAVSAAAAAAESSLAMARARLTDLRVAAALKATPKVRLILSRPAPAEGAPPLPVVGVSPSASGGAVQKAEETVARAIADLGEVAVSGLAGPLEMVRSAEGSAQASLALDHLRHEVQRLRDAAERERRDAQARELVLAALDGCTSEEARVVRDRLLGATSGSPSVTVEYARSLAQRERAHADAQYVEDSVLDVLEELGYQVGEAVGVSVAKHGVLVEVPGHPQHLARFHRAGDQLRFQVVRVGDGEPEGDIAAEVEACGIFAQVQQGLADQGVQWALTRREAPGAVPVARVEGGRPAAAAKRADAARPRQRRRARERDRERGR